MKLKESLKATLTFLLSLLKFPCTDKNYHLIDRLIDVDQDWCRLRRVDL